MNDLEGSDIIRLEGAPEQAPGHWMNIVKHGSWRIYRGACKNPALMTSVGEWYERRKLKSARR